MRLSSDVGVSSSVSAPGFSFCCYLAVHLWYLGWRFGSLKFALHVADTSPCLECSSLLSGVETLYLSGHICQHDQPLCLGNRLRE